MSDNLKEIKPQDAKRVNIHEDWELDYWCTHFNVSKEKLIDAVVVAGTSVDDVSAYLNKE
ncbi:MAG: DUF3606 domain-containing protein [Bacteroidota bacterium]